MRRLEDLADAAIALCRDRGWKRDWESGGVYLHLEVSEFIEALRGKNGSPTKEAGDILFVLLSMLRAHDINLDDVLARIEAKTAEMERSGYTGGYRPQE